MGKRSRQAAEINRLAACAPQKCIALAAALSSFSFSQVKASGMEEEILNLEKEFTAAIVRNDPEAIGRFVTDDWIIINADGGIIDKERFLGVIKSGTLTHEMMESDDVRIRVYGDSAVVSALTRTKGKFMGQEFSTHERATDFFVRLNGQWRCVLTQLTRFTK
jgi:ketosteroid isomerase-like protein